MGSLLWLSSHLQKAFEIVLRGVPGKDLQKQQHCVQSLFSSQGGGHRRRTLLSHSWVGASGLIPQGDQTLVASWRCLGTMETKEVKETLLSEPPTEPRGVEVLGSDSPPRPPPPCNPLILISCKLGSLLYNTSCTNASGCTGNLSRALL